jgi:hypothetical protein
LAAPLITDPLCTHVLAARQRALPVLADTGKQVAQTVSMPVLAESGIILPGTLARIVDGSSSRVGLVRGVSVVCGRPKVRQTLEIETHGY